jgi:hypothetical protein
MQNKPLVNINSAVLTLKKIDIRRARGRKRLKESRNPKGLRLSD